MRVIYIHQYFTTPDEGGAVRSYHLAKGLVESGVEVEMVTAHGRGHHDLKVVDGILVHYLPVSYHNSYGFLRRIVAFIRFVYLAKKLIKNLPRPDLFYITSTPLTTGFIGLWAKNKLDVPFIFEVRDLWPEAPIQMGRVRNKIIRTILYAQEEQIYRHALKIVALSPGIKQEIQRKCPEKEVFLIPNFADIHFFTPFKKQPGHPTKGRFTIVYAGTFGKANALHHLLELAKEARIQSKDWRFVLMGKGGKEKDLRALSQKLNPQNVEFLPFGNKEAVRDLLAVADAAYVSFDHFPVLRLSSPNKFFEAIAMGKAIIVNYKGWIYDMVKHHELGLFHNPAENASVIDRLEELSSDPPMLKQLQENSRSLAELCFSKERAVRSLLFVLDPVRFEQEAMDGACIPTGGK